MGTREQFAVTTLCCLIVALCGAGASAAALGVRFSPEIVNVQTAHPESSCFDLHTAAVTGQPEKFSILGPLIYLEKFGIDWPSSDPLYITSVTITLESASLIAGRVDYELTWDELTALLGSDDIYFPNGPIAIFSHVKDRQASYPPCGLAVGQIPFRDLSSPASGDITVTVGGYAEDSFGGGHDLSVSAIGKFTYTPEPAAPPP